MIDPAWPVVKRGGWLYDGEVPCTVRIVRGDVIYGSADDEDPPELQEDRECECYYVVYECQRTNSSSSGDAFLTLAEAEADVEKMLGQGVQWE
jgi:hypothetical protein